MTHMRQKIIKEGKYLELQKTETPTGVSFDIYEKGGSFFGVDMPTHATFDVFRNEKEAVKEFNKLEKKYEKFERGK